MSVVLESAQLTAGYGDLMAIRNVDLHIKAGEVVALFGPNGAGKSTTLLSLAGVLAPTSGQVRWDGRQITDSLHARARRGLAIVPEGRSVVNALSVMENLRLGQGTVERALYFFPQLSSLLRRPAGLLSGGEQQMLALGRALASQPRVLLADELSLGLAPVVVQQLLSILRAAATETGVAILIVEQRARQAIQIVDRWYLLRQGQIRAEGATSDGIEALEKAYLKGA